MKDAQARLSWFIMLTLRGRHRGCSGGEKAAREVALAVLEHATRLDDQAVDGLIEFIRLARNAPTTAGDLVEGVVDRAIII